MNRSRVIVTIMLFVLILSLMTALCSAKDNKPSDTKVTVILMGTTLFYYSGNNVSLWRKPGRTYHMVILLNQSRVGERNSNKN